MSGLWNNLFGGGPEKLFEKADNLAREECWPEAIDTLERAKAKLPENDRAARAEADRRIERYATAYKEHLATGVRELAADGDVDAARELLEVALSFASDEEEKRKLEALLAGEGDEAPAPAERAPTGDDRPADLIRGLADSYSETLEPAEKEAIFARSETFLRGFVLWNEGRYDDAARYLHAFLADVPHDPYGLMFLGLSHAGRGEQEEGARILEAAIRFEPSLVLAGLSLSIVLKDLGEPDRSASVLEKLYDIVTRYPDQFGPRRREEVVFQTVDTLLDAGNAEKAGRVYADARDTDLLPAHLPFEARMAEGMGDAGSAAAAWDAYLQPAAPGGGGAIVGHGSGTRGPTPYDFERGADFFRHQGDEKRACRYYQRGALGLAQRASAGGEAVPLGDLLRMRGKLAFTLISMGKANEAETIAREMEQLDPPPPEAAEIRRALEE